VVRQLLLLQMNKRKGWRQLTWREVSNIHVSKYTEREVSNIHVSKYTEGLVQARLNKAKAVVKLRTAPRLHT